jgi:tRNA-dihydrouridine synthase B
MWQIGSYSLSSRVVLAPMAGVSDLPFRQLCRQFGAGLAASEMLTSDSRLWDSRKGKWRIAGLLDETEPRVVQIAGSEPGMMAAAAKACVDRGAQIVDINMGCPAKKVCKRAAGSALLRDEPLVAAILQAVVAAVPVPVTLKMRTGWCPASRNAVAIGRLAEKTGVQAITLHGRTRACGYHAPVEYDTIAELVSQVSIPVIANGDINTPECARQVLDYTGAAAVMVGRAVHGQPWLVRDMVHYLSRGEKNPVTPVTEKYATVLQHIAAIHAFYGENQGVKMARKHVAWYSQHLHLPEGWRRDFNHIQLASQQLAELERVMTTDNSKCKGTAEAMAA